MEREKESEIESEREAKTKEASLTTRRLDNDLAGRYMRVSHVRLASRIASSTISRRVGDKAAIILHTLRAMVQLASSLRSDYSERR